MYKQIVQSFTVHVTGDKQL